MPKRQSSILTRLGGLVPDVDRICIAYGVDQRRAKKIQGSISAILEMVGDLVIKQAEFVESQEVTANLIERQMGRERDAVTILRNIDVFLAGDPATVQYVLEQVFVPVFAEAFGGLETTRQQALFASLREAVNGLKKHDGILAEP